MQERSADGWQPYETGEETPDHVTPRAELHQCIDEMSDEAVDRLLAVLHSWRDRYPSLLYMGMGLLVFSIC